MPNVDTYKKVKKIRFDFIQNGIFKFYNALVSPKSHTEDEQRKEFILNVILLGILGLMIILCGLVVYSISVDGPKYEGISFFTILGITFSFAALYYFSRIGYYTLASYILIVIFFLGALYGAYYWGTDLPSSLIAYALLIIISSVLINTKFSMVICITIISVTLLLGYQQSKTPNLPSTHWKQQTLLMADAVEYCILFIFILAVSVLSNREIEKSLKRARESENELKKEKDFLEVKIEERAQELRKLQKEKISQMERFVEFGKLASGFFHDLANPLTALSISIKQLKERTGDKTKQAEDYLEQAFDASERMETFLMSVKKQLQNSEEKSNFNINGIVIEVIDLLSYKSRKLGAIVVFKKSKNVNLIGDPIKLHQALLNLINNALECFELGKQNTKKVLVSLSQTNTQIKLCIEDNGPGIKTEELSKIFNPFYTTKQATGGLGLGLYRTKEIINESFQGKLEVVSGTDGTKFTITLPLNKNYAYQ